MADQSRDKKTSILIIEDEPALRDIYSTRLRMDGFEVLEAVDGIEGLDSAIQHEPEMILLDIVLPIKDGFEVLKDLKSSPKTRAIPVVIMSNLGQDYEVKRGMALGAESFLTKANLTPVQIVEQVRKLLATIKSKKDGNAGA
ncbi:MAG: Alkaline phosphatase synthesis transcriptional regulatory protein phoP, two-component system, OmpR [Candidatus Parcubacteria bacterium]|jgi:CheY-like chemotaxis protein